MGYSPRDYIVIPMHSEWTVNAKVSKPLLIASWVELDGRVYEQTWMPVYILNWQNKFEYFPDGR